MTWHFTRRTLAALVLGLTWTKTYADTSPYRWRNADVALELTEQDSRSSAGPRLRFVPSRTFAIDVPRFELLVAPFVSYSVLKTASSGKIGALGWGASVGAEYDRTYDLRWTFAGATWAGDNGTALTMGPEFGWYVHLGEGWTSTLDRVFLAAQGIWQKPYARQYVIGLQLQF